MPNFDLLGRAASTATCQEQTMATPPQAMAEQPQGVHRLGHGKAGQGMAPYYSDSISRSCRVQAYGQADSRGNWLLFSLSTMDGC